MTTVRSRTTVTSNIPLQPVIPSSSQSGAQIAAPQPATVQVPVVAHLPTPSATQGTPQTATSQTTAPPASQSATSQTLQVIGCSTTASNGTGSSSSVSTTSAPVNGSSPIPAPLPTTSVAANPSATEPTPIARSRWEKWSEGINRPVGWISIIITLVFGYYAYRFGATALDLQVWSAQNDQRDSCWTDREHGMNSTECDKMLAHPAIPPPSKRTESTPSQDLFNNYPVWFPHLIALTLTAITVFAVCIPNHRSTMLVRILQVMGLLLSMLPGIVFVSFITVHPMTGILGLSASLANSYWSLVISNELGGLPLPFKRTTRI
jgi:hypothetical protein